MMVGVSAMGGGRMVEDMVVDVLATKELSDRLRGDMFPSATTVPKENV